MVNLDDGQASCAWFACVCMFVHVSVCLYIPIHSFSNTSYHPALIHLVTLAHCASSPPPTPHPTPFVPPLTLFKPCSPLYRDQLGLNAADALALAEGGPRAERARQALLRNELQAGLSQLPKPSMEYAIEAPDLPEEEEGVAGVCECVFLCVCGGVAGEFVQGGVGCASVVAVLQV